MNQVLTYPKSKQPEPLTRRNCSRGAPMGLANIEEARPYFGGTVHLALLKMSPCGAYCANSGTYWGCASPKTGWMYRAWYYGEVAGDLQHIEMFVRGVTRRDAKKKVQERFPKARFYK